MLLRARSALLCWLAAATLGVSAEPPKCASSLRFSVIADPDKASRDSNTFTWHSQMLHGELVRQSSGNYTVEWGEETLLSTHTARKNRSLELSELVRHDGQWWTVCDVTGFIYTVDRVSGRLTHQYTAMDGDGTANVPSKLEWATEDSEGSLWLGSTGKPWQGARDSEWVKQIHPTTHQLTHHDWGDRFSKLRNATNTSSPGYLWHEAVHYWREQGLWVIAPRKESTGRKYDEKADEARGSNLVLTATADFQEIVAHRVGPREPTWGWSAIRALPNEPRQLFAALRVSEVEGHTQSTLAVFDLAGRFYLEPEPFVAVGSQVKFEGLEFEAC